MHLTVNSQWKTFDFTPKRSFGLKDAAFCSIYAAFCSIYAAFHLSRAYARVTIYASQGLRPEMLMHFGLYSPKCKKKKSIQSTFLFRKEKLQKKTQSQALRPGIVCISGFTARNAKRKKKATNHNPPAKQVDCGSRPQLLGCKAQELLVLPSAAKQTK